MTPVLIVTRPAPLGAAFAEAVTCRVERPLQVILSPLLRIVPVPFDKPTAEHIIFTSVNGVRQVANLPRLSGQVAWCVGQKTAQAARDAGFVVRVGPGSAVGLVEMIVDARPSGSFVHVHGRHTIGDVTKRMLAAGMQCRGACAYDQDALSLTNSAKNALCGEIPVVLPLFSQRTATILDNNAINSAMLHIIAISKAAMPDWRARTKTVASRPDGAAMIDATLDCIAAIED